MSAFIDANLLIYLNTSRTPANQQIYRNLYEETLLNYRCYTNILVLDETLYISRRKYGFSYEDTVEMIDSLITPYTDILPVGEQEYQKMTTLLKTATLHPSDALHVATMQQNNIKTIVTEDKEYDKIREIERIWLD